MGQRGHAHGHPLALLGLGRAGGREADADHLVDGRKQSELGETLEVPVDSRRKHTEARSSFRGLQCLDSLEPSETLLC